MARFLRMPLYRPHWGSECIGARGWTIIKVQRARVGVDILS